MSYIPYINYISKYIKNLASRMFITTLNYENLETG